jgi:hypothetical protein
MLTLDNSKYRKPEAFKTRNSASHAMRDLSDEDSLSKNSLYHAAGGVDKKLAASEQPLLEHPVSSALHCTDHGFPPLASS